MVRPIPRNIDENFCSIPLGFAIFLSISALVALCAKHARNSGGSGAVQRRSTKYIITIIRGKNGKERTVDGESDAGRLEADGGEGLWQKAILMGEKCQPPEFSGVIYYDYDGNRVPEIPRSPRASPLPRFYLPMEEDSSSSS